MGVSTETGTQNEHASAISTVPDKRVYGRPFSGPNDPRRSKGGRPKAWRNFERMLNKEHRNLAKSRELMTRLRALAMGETLMMVKVGTGDDAHEMPVLRGADPSFMKLYLGRVYGAEPNMETERVAQAIKDHLDTLMAEAERLEEVERSRKVLDVTPVDVK